ncbi:MAG TPA: beta-xylosidase, partial [Syntrophomonas sp.]|nr:beta-xylosidase [Syntrophomonas sp.]
VTANWTYKGGGGSGSGSSTPTTPAAPAAPAYKAEVKEGSGAETTIPVTVDKDAGTASIDTGLQNLNQGGTVITMPSIPGTDTYSVGIPVPDLSTTNVQGTLTLNTDAGSITVTSNMLTGVAGADGNKAQITIGHGDKSNLPENVRDAVGDRPLVQLTLSIDGRQTDWSNPNAPVTISIPYVPTTAELANPESIVIWYIDGNGKAVSVPNGHYNPETGTVTFTTTHFSYYAVSYNHMSFKDVANDAWYAKAVSFIAAREITTGTGGGNFSPEAKLTRGQFIVMLMKSYGIAPDLNAKDNFADAGNTYYTGYLAAAKKLGISAGVGNNMFVPEKEITRQEMFTLLYNALKVIGKLPQGDTGKTLSNFSDANDLSIWAKDAMTLFVETGTVSGSGNRLSPKDTTTRAQMAQVLYSLLSK